MNDNYLAEVIAHNKNNLLEELRALKNEIAEMEKALENDRLLPEMTFHGAGHLSRYATAADKHAHTYNAMVRVGFKAVESNTSKTPSEVVEALNAG